MKQNRDNLIKNKYNYNYYKSKRVINPWSLGVIWQQTDEEES